MRRATGLLVVVLAFCGIRTALADGAERLGEIWRLFEAGEYRKTIALSRKLRPRDVRNPDYRLFATAQSRAMVGEYSRAAADFASLARDSQSRFAAIAPWRQADCLWRAGRKDRAARLYRKLVKKAANKKRPPADIAVAEFRLAKMLSKRREKKRARAAWERFLISYPLHPLAETARTKLEEHRGGSELHADERIERASRLRRAKKWHEAVAELERIGDNIDDATKTKRDFEMAMTFFKMRRQYERAGRLLLSIFPDLGSNAAYAMFHGARSLSRADVDKEAISWYQRLVARYPRSQWAAEAQYLSGWLEFNLGNYREAIPHLRTMRRKFPRSRWAQNAKWFLGMSHYFLGDWTNALSIFDELSKRRGRLEGGKGHYWKARTLEKMKRTTNARTEYLALVGRYPLSWYALLAQARLAEAGIDVGPFGEKDARGAAPFALGGGERTSMASDPLHRRVDELILANMGDAAAFELRRGERAFLRRHGRTDGLRALFTAYRRAGHWHRPWMLAVIHGGEVLRTPPTDDARAWWEHAYPLAYRDPVERFRRLGNAPKYWLYAIMRKESGFDPHVHSYADARGLLQMIPPTTRRVATAIGIDYSDDLLFDPAANIQVGSWYIGRLYKKFKGQVPVAAGSYNSGPKAVMRWLEKNRGRPTDEWVELVSYRQTRGYMKKVTETYARYLFLYTGKVYRQPLTLDFDPLRDNINY